MVAARSRKTIHHHDGKLPEPSGVLEMPTCGEEGIQETFDSNEGVGL